MPQKVPFMERLLLALMDDGAILRSKGQGQGHWERKYKNRFCLHETGID